MTAPVGEEEDLRAAELAFGLLDPAERTADAARLAADPRLARRFAAWERLATTLFGTPEEPPRPSLWAEIDAALPGGRADLTAAERVARWRTASLVLGALAALLGIVAARRR